MAMQMEQSAFWETLSDEPRVEVAPSFATPLYQLVTEPSQLETLLPRLLAAPVLGLDTETTGLDPFTARLRLIQLAIPELTVVVDVQTCPVQALIPLFSEDRQIVFHNAGFDLGFLVTAGLPWPTRIFDTMLASQLLGAGSVEGTLSQCGLGTVVKHVLGLTLPKDEQRSRWDGSLSSEQIQYAARDAAVLLPLADRLKREIRTARLERVAEIEHRCVLALTWLELTGLPIDAQRWLARAAAEEERVRTLEKQLHALVGWDITRFRLQETPFINWQSPTQVLEVFRSRGYTINSTESATLTVLDDPLAHTLLEYREAVIRAGTFGQAWLEKHQHTVTGRIHANYLQLGAASGRMSCINPNVQNIPRSPEYRTCIRPEEGRVLVKADLSQIELRIVAAIANDIAMLLAFQFGQDLHTLTAANVCSVPIEQIEKSHRQLAKALNFGLLYGMGTRRLREYAAHNYGVSLTEKHARQYKQAFFRSYPGLYRWHKNVASQLEREQCMNTRTLTGRRQLGVKHYTIALNSPVQGTGADGLKLALARLFERRQEVPEVQLVAVVHDEIVAECPAEDAQQTALWLKQQMTDAMSEIVGGTVPVEVEVTIGRDWAGSEL